MMIRVLRDLLRSYLKENASNQVRHQKSKLLIYDEYLGKYVGAEEMLIPAIRGKNQRAVSGSQSKKLFVFDVLFKKFVNPNLDLLVPRVKSLDLLIKFDTSDRHKDIHTSSRDFEWEDKKSENHAACLLPLVNTKTGTDTEPTQVGWAGQKIRKPNTDPRPELGKPECNFGPSKDPKKDKPKKKERKNMKYIVCSKVKELKKNMKDFTNKMDTEKLKKDKSKYSKNMIDNEENCYSDPKEKKKPLKSQHLTNRVSKTSTKSVAKVEIPPKSKSKEPEKNKTNNANLFKTVCTKLFQNEGRIKKSPTKGRIADPPKKTNASDLKDDTLLNKNEIDCENLQKNSNDTIKVKKCKSDLKNNCSSSLQCLTHKPSSLVLREDFKTTDLYLYKEKKDKSKSEQKPVKTESLSCKSVCPPNTESKNKTKCDTMETLKATSEENDGEKCSNTNASLGKLKTENVCCKSMSPPVTESKNKTNCETMETFKTTSEKNDEEKCSNTNASLNKVHSDVCSEGKSIKDSCMDQVKQECKKALAQRPSTSPIKKTEYSKAKEHTTSMDTQSSASKSKTSLCNSVERPKTACSQKPCPKTSSMATSGEPTTKDCNNNKQNVIKLNNKCDQINEDHSKCASSDKSKMTKKCSENNDLGKQNPPKCKTSKCPNIDLKSTEKLQCIAQEEVFKRADSSIDLTKCSSYLGFKVKKECSKTKEAKESSLKEQNNDCKKMPPKEIQSKKKFTTALKTTKSHDDSGQSKTISSSLRACKTESVSNEEPKKQTLDKCKNMEQPSLKSTCINNVSPKQELKTNVVCGSDTKGSLKDNKNKLSQKKSSTKTSKKCKSKSALDKQKKAGKKKSTTCTTEKEHKDKPPTKKSSPCTEYSASSEYKDLKENIKYPDTGKDDSSCKNVPDQVAHDEDKTLCCKETEKEFDKTCSEKSPAPDVCQPTSGKETVQCPTAQAKIKDTNRNKSNIGEQKCEETNENKKKEKLKDCCKHNITGATQRKKRNLCTKIKSFQNVRSQGSSNKTNNSKVKNTSSKNPQKNKEPSINVQSNKSAQICSKPNSNIDVEKTSKKSKSKRSVCAKASKESVAKSSKKTSKSQNRKKSTKLKQLVKRAQCNTDSGNTKNNTVTHALTCSKSTPSIQPAKHNKTSSLIHPHGANKVRPLTSKPPENCSKKTKAFRNEVKSTKMCSLHTLQKRRPETPIKTPIKDVKSFSELKRAKSERDISTEFSNSGNFSLLFNLQWNKHKADSGTIVKDAGTIEERKVETTNQKEERNCFKTPQLKDKALIDPTNKTITPYFKHDKCFQLLLDSLKNKSEAIKLEPKKIFEPLRKNTRNDSFIANRNVQVKCTINSLDNFKECTSKARDSKTKFQENSSLMFSKDDTNNTGKYHKTNNTNKIFRVQTKNKNAIIKNPNKIATNGFQDINKCKGEKLITNEHMISLVKEVAKETVFTEGFKDRSLQATTSIAQLKLRDNFKDMKGRTSGNQQVRTSSVSAISYHNPLRIPHEPLGPCKTKSFCAFNTIKLHDATTRPLRSSKIESKNDSRGKIIDSNLNQNQDNVKTEMPISQTNQMSYKTQFQFGKNEKSENNYTKQVGLSQFCDKNQGGGECLIPKKVENLQANRLKSKINTIESINQTNGRKNNDNNKKVICDFIEGASNVNVENIEPQYLDKNTNYFINQQLKELQNQPNTKSGEKDNTTMQLIKSSNNYLKFHQRRKQGCKKVIRSTLNNRTLIIDEIEKHVYKLESVVPSMKRTFKPVYLNRWVSKHKNQKLNKKLLAEETPIKDNTLGKETNKVPSPENNPLKENNTIRQPKRIVVDEITNDRTIAKVHITPPTPNISGNLQEITVNKFLNNVKMSASQNKEIKTDTFLNKGLANKTSFKSKYLPKSKTKMLLISKRHKFTNHSNKKASLSAAKKDSRSFEKLKTLETTETSLKMLDKNNNSEQQDISLNKTASLSLKQRRLLMDQSFYKTPKSELATGRVQHLSEAEASLSVYNKDNVRGQSSPKQTAKQFKLLMEQPFYKLSKRDPNTGQFLGNSKSDNNFQTPKCLTENNIYSSKSKIDLIALKKDDVSGVSPRTQQSSIRSQLQRKIPLRAEIKQVNLKKTERDQ